MQADGRKDFEVSDRAKQQGVHFIIFFQFYISMGALVSIASIPAPSCAYSMASDKVGTVPPDKCGRRGIRRDIDLGKVDKILILCCCGNYDTELK